jgi:hypothetical protein
VNYAERLGRVAVLGLAALIAVSLVGSAFLLLYSIPIQNIALKHLWDFLEAALFVGVLGLLPVLVYAVPIFTAYLSSAPFHPIYVFILAALPGLLLLLQDSLLWSYFLPFGLGVAFAMEVISRLWPEKFGRDAA